MITLLIAFLCGGGTFVGFFALTDSKGWSFFLAIVAFLVVQIVASLYFRKKLLAIQETIKNILGEGKSVQEKEMQRLQWRITSQGDVAQAQKKLMEMMKVYVRRAIEAADAMDRYRWWIPALTRQKAMVQFQLAWMIQDFKMVDELMPKILLIEPTTVAMKLARLQMKGAPLAEITKTYEKGARRLKYNQNVLLAACYTWILVKRGEIDLAFKSLTEALKNSDNETLKRNHENLMNNRVAHFNNSGLGEQWYALWLEQPKTTMQRPRSVYR